MAEQQLATLQEATGDGQPPTGRVQDPVGEIAKLLQPDPAPAQDQSPETGDQAATPPAETWDLQSVAEKLGTDPAKLYDLKLRVGEGDGVEVTLSQLKDAYRPAAELEKARTQLVEETSRDRREALQLQQELAALVQLLPREVVTQALVEQATQQAARLRSENADKLLQALPEWKDPIRKAADWADIRAAGRELGYSEAELEAAKAGFADPRMLRALLGYRRAPAEQPKPAAKVGAKPTSGGKPTAAQQHGQLKAAVTTRRMSPEVAAAQILKQAGIA